MTKWLLSNSWYLLHSQLQQSFTYCALKIADQEKPSHRLSQECWTCQQCLVRSVKTCPEAGVQPRAPGRFILISVPLMCCCFPQIPDVNLYWNAFLQFFVINWESPEMGMVVRVLITYNNNTEFDWIWLIFNTSPFLYRNKKNQFIASSHILIWVFNNDQE